MPVADCVGEPQMSLRNVEAVPPRFRQEQSAGSPRGSKRHGGGGGFTDTDSWREFSAGTSIHQGGVPCESYLVLYIKRIGSLRPVVDPRVCIEGCTRVHDALEVAGSLAEGFGGMRFTIRKLKGRGAYNIRRLEQEQQLVGGI